MFLKTNNTYRFIGEGEVLKELPPSYFMVSKDLTLTEITPRSIPKTIFGDIEKTAEYYYKAYQEHKKGFGILLSGNKGSGKTLLANLISHKFKLPTIIIQTILETNEISSIVQSLKTPSIILIDEFEKLYNEVETQDSLLSILDGSVANEHIFILTVNDENKVSKYLINRPGRIKYKKTFTVLTAEEIDEIVAYYSLDENTADTLKVIGDISYDSITSILDEMTLMNTDVNTVIKHLNILPEEHHYSVNILKDNKRHTLEYYGHPLLTDKLILSYYKEGSWRPDTIEIDRTKSTTTFTDNGIKIESDNPYTVAVFTKFTNKKLSI